MPFPPLLPTGRALPAEEIAGGSHRALTEEGPWSQLLAGVGFVGAQPGILEKQPRNSG